MLEYSSLAACLSLRVTQTLQVQVWRGGAGVSNWGMMCGLQDPRLGSFLGDCAGN